MPTRKAEPKQRSAGKARREPAKVEPPDPQLEEVIARIRSARNFDFRNYKRGTLRRRIERRISERQCSSIDDYLKLLERDPAEYDALISSMLIKVTSFFRDPETWEALSSTVIPEILSAKRAGEEIRIWCAGCATGEEAYTTAILFADAMGLAALSGELKVFGTDLEDSAVAFARHGVYTGEQVEAVPARLRRYFVQDGDGFQVAKEIRRAVVFGVNNLVSDAPISRLDLLICRNVFIYLDAELQKRVLTRFHYALRRRGLLMLGKSELIPFAARVFEPIDVARRIYRKNGRRDVNLGHDRFFGLEQDNLGRGEQIPKLELNDGFHRAVLDSVSAPVIATTPDGTVVGWNAAASALWGRAEPEVTGKKLAALGLGGLPGELLVERTAAVREGRSRSERALGVLGRDNDHRALEIEISPMRNADNALTGLVYCARDVTSVRDMEQELRKVNSERQNAYEELQTLNEEMQSSNEELETTNEELQSANEELQTTNEELQSTNEELETTNEELQSTNAELDATNRELAARTEEVNTLAFFQRTIIRSMNAAVVVLDAQGAVKVWNLAAERLLGLSEEEAQGQVLWTLHVPALSRASLQRVRKALAQQQSVRGEIVEYELHNGARGSALLTAVPIVEEGEALGSVLILEDTTRLASLAAEVARLKAGNGARRK